MTWLYFLSFPLLLPILTIMTGVVSAALWWLPRLARVAPAMRWGRGMSPVIQGICGTLFVLATTFLSSRRSNRTT